MLRSPIKELYRERVRFRALENVICDFRFAVRQYGKNPGFTVAAALSLALGSGAKTALFSFVNAILLRGKTNFEALRTLSAAPSD